MRIMYNVILGYEMAKLLCKDYASTKGAGTAARPSDHKFFLRLGPLVQKSLEKANHENGFM